MMTTTEIQIIEIIRRLSPSALEEVKIFLDYLAWRDREQSSQNRGLEMVAAMRGKATAHKTTDEIMNLTRGNE